MADICTGDQATGFTRCYITTIHTPADVHIFCERGSLGIRTILSEMHMINYFLTTILVLGSLGCLAQNDKKMEAKNNPLLCDPQEGICETPAAREGTATAGQPAASLKPVKIIYFTDPICSSCWGIEPQLRRLKLEYGHHVEIVYHMGGLLPDWSYNSGGISKPSDVAHHWDEVSGHYRMPIDGDVWLEDPLHSSYPPSIAFKAAQLQDPVRAIAFLRAIREMVFLEKKNITRWEHLSAAAVSVGLDPVRLQQDYESEAEVLFRADLDLARSMGVRGFPTLFVTDSLGNRELVYGFKPYTVFEAAIRKIDPSAGKMPYDKGWQGLFSKYPSLTAREFAELSDLSPEQGRQELDRLTDQGKLTKFTTKNGAIWRRTAEAKR